MVFREGTETHHGQNTNVLLFLYEDTVKWENTDICVAPLGCRTLWSREGGYRKQEAWLALTERWRGEAHPLSS